MATGCFRDFGIVRPRYSIYSFINVDPDRNKLYVFSVPFAEEDQQNDGCHVYSIDIQTGEMQDLGKPAEKGRNASFWSYVDPDGDCWFTMWGAGGRFSAGGRGNLYRLAAGSGRIECFEDVLPEARLWLARWETPFRGEAGRPVMDLGPAAAGERSLPVCDGHGRQR